MRIPLLGRGLALWTCISLFLAILPLNSRHAAAGIAWTIEVADGQYGAGRYPSIAISPSGWPGVSYQVNEAFLAYAWRDAAGWHNSTVDPGASAATGLFTSLAFDQSGIPHIAYLTWPVTGSEVCYAYWNASSFSWVIEHVANAGGFLGPSRASLALNASGSPRIAYVHVDTGELSYATRDSAGTWTAEYVSRPGCCDLLSLKVDSKDVPHIAVYNYSTPGLDYLSKSGSTWIRESVEAGQWVGASPSLALDSNDLPRIAYIDVSAGHLKYAVRKPTEWNITVLPTGVDGASTVSLALDASNRPRIAYTFGSDIMYAYWDAPTWRVSPVIDDWAWLYVNLAVDNSGVAHIAYLQADSDGGLKYAKGVLFNDPPISFVQPVSPYWWNAGPLTVHANASDPDGSVTLVDLYYRFDGGSGWSSWTPYGSAGAPPWQWSFTLPNGEGLYEFYSLAFDSQDWEVKTAGAEASVGYDSTPPVSNVLPISPYWHNTPSLVVDANASDDRSGVNNVTLLYSYSPDNLAWGSWTAFGTTSQPPWSWSFTWPDGEGHYRFHTIATDVAGNVEGGKTMAEAQAGYFMPPDYMPTNPLPSSPQSIDTSTPLQFSVEVRNSGGSANLTAMLAFTDSVTPSTPFATFLISPLLAGDTAGPFTADWTSPATPCSCTVTAQVDYDDDIAESDESNNNYTWTIDVASAPVTKADYVPTQTEPPTPLKIGPSSTVLLSLRVLNKGNATAQANATILAFYSEPPPTLPFAEFVVFPLPPSDMSPRYTAEWTSPPILGVYSVTADVDYFDHETEWNETNNLHTWIIEVVIGPITSLVVGAPNYTSTATYVRSSTALSLSVSDRGGTGINFTRYRIDSDEWTDYGGQFFLVGEGEHLIEWYSEDNVGNREDVAQASLWVDDTPPSTAASPANCPCTTDTLFTLAATDGGSGVNVTRYRIDVGGWMAYAGGFALTEGEHIVSFFSKDNLNNMEEERWLVVTVQGTPPPDSFSQYWWLVVVIVAVVTVLLLLALMRRRKPREEEEEVPPSE